MQDSKLRDTARRLRKNMTPEEVHLWSQLRYLNKQGFHFRRQVPLDGYILDFAEFKFRLILEVDGSQHGMPGHLERDQKRDAHFKASGFKILRFWNSSINTNMTGCIDHILASARERGWIDR